MTTFDRLESNVRSYCRSFPAVFDRARGAELFTEDGGRYLDFFAGAGALNYGHDPAPLKDALLTYLGRGGVVHSLDFMTVAKRNFLESLETRVLLPRGLDYKVQFPGPTGTNAVEAALKLARKVTGRTTVVSFTNGFHGMTLGALAVTGNRKKRTGAGVPLTHARILPFDGYMGGEVSTIDLFEHMLEDESSGLELPAAVVLETTQAEGGVNVASTEWIRRLDEVCRRRGILVILDDIQVGCGRAGSFFSFERAGIVPDIVCLSKSLSGYGLPFAVVLMRREFDAWSPGEHNGTFRGFDLAFVTARAALETYWRDQELMTGVGVRALVVRRALAEMAGLVPNTDVEIRGIGLIHGMRLPIGFAKKVSQRAFEKGLVIETAGPRDEVVKLLPPLDIPIPALEEGLDILRRSLQDVIADSPMTEVSDEDLDERILA